MLGQRIHSLRLSFGWSQVDVAQKLSVSKQTVSNWENDNIQPSIEMLVRLAELFHVSTDYLLGREQMQRISTDGLPDSVIAHMVLLMEDYRGSTQPALEPKVAAAPVPVTG